MKVKTHVLMMVLVLGLAGTIFASSTKYDFDDGTLQGWTNNVPVGSTGEDFFPWDTAAATNGGRTVARSMDYLVLEDDFSDRDSDTNVKVLSSPEMTLNSFVSISIWTLGGTGAVDVPTWTNHADLPSDAGDDFMGAALRRVSDGEYLLFDRRSAPGQSNRNPNWLKIGWDATEITAVIAGDDPAETYQIDLIDTFSGGWGWIAMDDVAVIDPDLDGSGIVDLNDFYLIRDNYLNMGEAIVDGDVNLNGIVDEIDFRIWKDAFFASGNSPDSLPDLFDVPEPATLLLLGSGVSLLIGRRRKN